MRIIKSGWDGWLVWVRFTPDSPELPFSYDPGKKGSSFITVFKTREQARETARSLRGMYNNRNQKTPKVQVRIGHFVVRALGQGPIPGNDSGDDIVPVRQVIMGDLAKQLRAPVGAKQFKGPVA